MSANRQKLSPRLIIGLAAPHTWLPISIIPVLFATVLSLSSAGFSAGLFYAVLAISILMQSSVNTLNDYFDYLKGTDTLENSPDSADAILVYHNLNIKSVGLLGLSFLALAALPGVYVTVHSGTVPLLLGLIGGLVVLTYSAGPRPLSYLPLGEAVSGLAVGGLLPLAVYAALNNGRLYLPLLLYCLPLIVGIALIMMANNISDIERDHLAGRLTLPLLLGRERSRRLFRSLTLLWLIATPLLAWRFFAGGLFVLPLGLLLSAKQLKWLLSAALTPQQRGQNMSAVFSANVAVNAAYTLAALVSLAG